VVTAIPLLLFAAGARRLKLATVGLIQYIGPTIQLALGVLLFGEPFDSAKLFGFSLIWLACCCIRRPACCRCGHKSAWLPEQFPSSARFYRAFLRLAAWGWLSLAG
jgi:drug/metabolite transporter (DMT)-like permease